MLEEPKAEVEVVGLDTSREIPHSTNRWGGGAPRSYGLSCAEDILDASIKSDNEPSARSSSDMSSMGHQNDNDYGLTENLLEYLNE